MEQKERVVKTWIRTADLAVWLLLLSVLSLFAYYKGSFTVTTWVLTKTNPPTQAVLNLRELLYIAAPLLTFIFTILAHVVDRCWAGGGMAQRADEIKHLHSLETDVITGTMTKQSVLVALAAILIVFVQQGPAETSYTAFVRWLSSAGFLTSILLMLISVKTYDYANRFNWEKHPEHLEECKDDKTPCYYRIQLANKAFRLDIIAFYFLLFTAILATGLIERWFPILASLLCGYVLWKSYFFFDRKKPWTRRVLDSLCNPNKQAEDAHKEKSVEPV